MQLQRIRIWIRVMFSLLVTFPGVRSKILTPEETADQIIKGRSLIRFGDGEFGIYKGKDIHYQKYSKELGVCFNKIKDDYEQMGNACPYLLAVPKKYMQCSSLELCKKRVLVSCWSEARYSYRKHFNRSLTYGDAFLFERSNVSIYDQIWENKASAKNIVFVHNNPMYAEIFARKYSKNVYFVKCPPKNSFDSIDDIYRSVLEKIRTSNKSKSDVQIVISSGPTGKVLVHRFSMEGFHCIDAGHCWDDPLES